MRFRNIIIVGVLLLLLCGIAGAATEEKYTKSKNGVLFQRSVNTDSVDIAKENHKITISSSEHMETKIKIKRSDIEALDGFTGTLQVSHFTDSGVNDWNRVITPVDNNGYYNIEVEFSAVTLTVTTSPIVNWNFEAFTGDAPDSWTVITAGGAKTVYLADAYVSSYAYKITGGSGNKGNIQQAITLAANTEYTFGAWIKTSGVTSGNSPIYITDGTGSTIAALWTYGIGTTDYTWYETTVDTTGHSGPYKIALYAYDFPSTSYICYDGILVGKSVDIGGAEVIDTVNCTAAISFTYTPDQDYTSDVVTVDFTTISLGDYRHGTKGAVVAQVGAAPVTAYLGGSKLYLDGVTMTSGVPYNFYAIVPFNLPPTLISPTNGSTITREFPPLYASQVFTWSDTSTTCQIQIAEDSAFSNVVYSTETTAATATASLAAGTYYWRVRSYDSILAQYGAYPASYSVVVVTTTGSIVGTGIAGCVYESKGLGNYQVVSGALATVYNDTYSTTKTTGSEGYYQVLGLSEGTYYVSIKKTGYDASDITPVNVTAGEVVIQNIAIQQAQSYFAPTDCSIKVKQHWYSFSGVSGVAYSYYQNGDTATQGTGTTDSTGRFTMSNVNIGTKYRIVLTTDDGTQTDYITPSSSELSFIIVLDLTEAPLLPDSQFYDVVNVSVSKLVLNSTAASVTVNWEGNSSSMTEVYYRIGQTANNGTFVMLDDYTETPTGTLGNHSFVVSDYLGQSYKVIVEFTEDSFGEVEKTYTVTFAGSTVPFIGGKALSYFGVFLVFVVAMMFGKAEHAVGGLMVCGFSWFLWYLDVFTGFGAATNTTMAAGLIIGTVFALLAVINEARKGANI